MGVEGLILAMKALVGMGGSDGCGWAGMGPETDLNGLGWYDRSGMGIEGLGWVGRAWDSYEGPRVVFRAKE